MRGSSTICLRLCACRVRPHERVRARVCALASAHVRVPWYIGVSLARPCARAAGGSTAGRASTAGSSCHRGRRYSRACRDRSRCCRTATRRWHASTTGTRPCCRHVPRAPAYEGPLLTRAAQGMPAGAAWIRSCTAGLQLGVECTMARAAARQPQLACHLPAAAGDHFIPRALCLVRTGSPQFTSSFGWTAEDFVAAGEAGRHEAIVYAWYCAAATVVGAGCGGFGGTYFGGRGVTPRARCMCPKTVRPSWVRRTRVRVRHRRRDGVG